MALRVRASGILAGQTVPAESARVPSLRFWRTQRMLGQVELAVRAGVHPTSVQRGEMGVPLRPAIIAKLAEALNCDPAALMDTATTE
ncbi:MAG: helix-turn-helix domain-containing protein [Chloroflexota bacterium]|nr:helix-turn-helix domain-containing protein [Chloroflexota bacterium]